MNRLYYGDCLTVMQDMESASVDLIYLDPPFNSNREYNAIYKDETGRPLPDQVEAFCDLWTLDAEREHAIRRLPVIMRETGIDDAVAEFWRIWMGALRNTHPRMLAYLSYMTERLLVMKRVLKLNGSLYLHCDPTAAHYIKVMMDTIFGHRNFRNELIWRRTGSHNSLRTYGAIHDTILFYSVSDDYKFNVQKRPYSIEHVEKRYKVDSAGRAKQVTGGNILTGAGASKGESGEPWRGFDPTKKDRHWAIPTFLNDELPAEKAKAGVLERLDALYEMGLIEIKVGAAWPHPVRYLQQGDGQPYQDIWAYQPYTSGVLYGTGEGIDEDVMWPSPTSPERLGYKTQKPVGLLSRIIRVSSDPGDLVFDPFCGCATTIEAAHNLGRQWVGIDIAIHAVKRVASIRLRDRLGLIDGKDYEIQGVPGSLEGARDLWTRDKYHFQKWAVEQVDGFVTAQRTADGGIDGRLYFEVPDEKDLQSMALEVKGGENVGIADVRALHGVLNRDGASMAGLIVMDELGERKRANFAREMASAGELTVETENAVRTYPRMQMLTVSEILKGKRFDTPYVVGKSEKSPLLPGAGAKSRRTAEPAHAAPARSARRHQK